MDRGLGRVIYDRARPAGAEKPAGQDGWGRDVSGKGEGMSLFRQVPIQRKLIMVILVTGVATLLLASAALYGFEWFYAQKRIARDLMTLGDIAVANCSTALKEGDNPAAAATLNAFKAKPHLIAASLFLPDGKVLASFGLTQDRPLAPEVTRPGCPVFDGSDLVLYCPVVLEGKTAGALFLRYDYEALQREITQPYLKVFLCLIVPAVGLLALLLSSVLQRIVSAPILRLIQSARSAAAEKNIPVGVASENEDELGVLTATFNQMLERIGSGDSALRQAHQSLADEATARQQTKLELEELHKRIVELSRKAGMAEVATGVLHNIGNVLNSVNVSTTLAIDRLRQSKLPNVVRVAALLEEGSTSLEDFLKHDPRGLQLPEYLATLAQVLTEDQIFVLKELDVLRRHIDHIKDIVAMQQNYARVAGVVETVQVSELIEDAIRFNAGALTRHGVEVRKEYGDIPAITVEKPKVLQILINLIRNAKYALDDSHRPDKVLTFRVTLGWAGRVQIHVVDNGIGIPPENLTRIFGHGFTTRKDGHGFGLHSGALAAQDLGGSLVGHSDGLGKGAVFTLELPLHPRKEAPGPLSGQPA